MSETLTTPDTNASSGSPSSEMFEVECLKCHNKVKYEKAPDASWKCLCEIKPKPWSKLLKCSAGHVTWIRSYSDNCDECEKEKKIKTAKKLLEIQSDPKRAEMDQNTVEINRKIRQKKEDHIKREKLIDDSILEIPHLLKDLITEVNSLKQDEINSKKLENLESQIKDMEAKFAE